MAEVETKTTVRLTKEDEENIERIVATGIATNTAEAIRVALALVGRYLTAGSVLEIVQSGPNAPTVRASITVPHQRASSERIAPVREARRKRRE